MKTRQSLPVTAQLKSKRGSENEGWMLELARWYEADWANAVESDDSDPPSENLVLEMIEPQKRESLREVLSSIRERYLPDYEANKSTWNGDLDATIDTGPVMEPSDQTSEAAADQVTMDSAELAGAIENAETQTPEHVPLDVTLDPSTGFGPPQDETIDPEAQTNSGLSADGLDATFDSDAPAPSSGSAAVVRSGKSAAKSTSRNSQEQNNTKRKAHLPGYEIQKVLGRGGMGVVYLAMQEGIERPVALKMILGGMHVDKYVLARFEAEARAIGKFQHENIVRIYDFGTHEDIPYFALEFIEGEDLSKRINGEPMPVREAAEMAKSIAEAMQYSHEAGVLHRDLKPGNVLLTKDGVPKVTDFGLAKELEDDAGISRTGAVVGTPAFMPPEQAMGRTDIMGPQADVYGVGAVLYCMLTGRPPFQSTKATDTLLQVINNDPVEPVALQPGIPKDLQTICMKALQKDLAKRYGSAKELADDLGRYLRDEPILARPVTRVERVTRWCRRNPKVAIPVATAAVLALAVLIGGPLSAAMIYQQKERVVSEKVRADNNAAEAKRNAERALANAVVAQENEKEALEAKALADANAEAAQVQEKLSIDALKSMTFEVQKRMQGDPRLRGIRENLLVTVRKGLERMEKQGKDTQAHNMIAAGIAVRKGDLNLEIGRVAAATASYRECLEIMEELHERNELPSAQQNLSKIHVLLATAAREQGKFEVADEEFTTALQIRRDWVPQEPKVARPLLADVLTQFGQLSEDRGDLQMAHKLLDEALEIRKALHKAEPKGKGRFTDILKAKMALSKVVFQSGQHDEGLTLISEAAEGMQRYLGWNPKSNAAIVNAALYNSVRGRMLLYLGKTDEAIEIFAAATSQIRDTVDRSPDVFEYRKALDRTLYPLGVAQRLRGKNGSQLADATLRESLALRREFHQIEPDNDARTLNLAITLARLGKRDEALKLAEQVRESIKEDATVLYHLGCVYAQLVGLQVDADKDPNEGKLLDHAIESLASAIRAGFNRPTDLELDPDLAPIRELKPFMQLVSQKEQE